MKLQKTVSDKRPDQFFLYLPIRIIEALNWKKGENITLEIVGKDMLKIVRKKPSPGNDRGVL